jgi:hypothetical protein
LQKSLSLSNLLVAVPIITEEDLHLPDSEFN